MFVGCAMVHSDDMMMIQRNKIVDDQNVK